MGVANQKSLRIPTLGQSKVNDWSNQIIAEKQTNRESNKIASFIGHNNFIIITQNITESTILFVLQDDDDDDDEGDDDDDEDDDEEEDDDDDEEEEDTEEEVC